MSYDLNVSNLTFTGKVYNTSNKAEYAKNSSSKKTSNSEDELVEYKESGKNEVDVLQQKRERELEKYFTYQDRIAELERKRARYEEKLEQYKDKPQRAKRYQTKLSRINSQISEWSQKCSQSESKMTSLSSQINEELNKELNKETEEAASNAGVQTLGYNSMTQSAPAVNLVSSSKSVYQGTNIPTNLANKLDSKLGSGFSNKCEQVANYLNCNVNDLLAMMYSESGINPKAGNPNGGAVGLIQFMPSVLASNGYSTSQVKNMSAIQQLDLVAEFLMKSKKMAGYGQNDKVDAGTLYGLCFLPAVAKNEVLCASGGQLSWAYSANSGLDMDKNGSITKTDLANRLAKKFQELNTYYV